jgi:thioredoxin 1
MLSSLANDTNLGEGLTVIKFFATWCRPCKLYAPVFERVAALNPEVDFYTVDIDEDPSFKDRYGIKTVPTTLFFKNGRPTNFLVGAQSTGRLDEAVKDVLDKRS